MQHPVYTPGSVPDNGTVPESASLEADITFTTSSEMHEIITRTYTDYRQLLGNAMSMICIAGKCERHLNRLHAVFSISIIFLGPIAAVFTGMSESSRVMLIVATTLGVVSGIMAALVKFLQHEKHIAEFRMFSTQMSRLLDRLKPMYNVIEIYNMRYGTPTERLDANVAADMQQVHQFRASLLAEQTAYENVLQLMPAYYIPTRILLAVKAKMVRDGVMLPVILRNESA